MSADGKQCNKLEKQWATLVVQKGKGGRAIVLNESSRGIFQQGETYYNHQLKAFLPGVKLNVTVRLSATGRRMVQGFLVKEVPSDKSEVPSGV